MKPTRTLTIALPEDELHLADEMAGELGISLNDVFRRSIGAFRLRLNEIERGMQEQVNPDDPNSPMWAEVNAMVKETRADMRREKVGKAA